MQHESTIKAGERTRIDNLTSAGSCIYADIDGGGRGNVILLATINESRAERQYAPLFEASPDLLEALKAFVEYAETYGQGSECAILIKNAQEVIAKAEGK